MTVTFYEAEYTDKTGDRFHASIFWDKYHQRSLAVHLCRYLSASEVGSPIWSVKGRNSRAGLDSLKAKLAARVNRIGLTLVSERETQYAPNAGDKSTAVTSEEKLPDPTEKSVIILKGEFAGQEGYCLGPAGEKGMYAVTPNTSNRVLELRFDEEFGILFNQGQETGRN